MLTEEIKRSAEEIVEEFVKATSDLPEVEESYYSSEEFNLTRPDGEPSSEEERSEFRARFLSIAPGSDDEGRVRVEVAKWVER